MINKIGYKKSSINEQYSLLRIAYVMFWNLFDASVFDMERKCFSVLNIMPRNSKYTYDNNQSITMNTTVKKVIINNTNTTKLPEKYEFFYKGYNYFGARYYDSEVSVWLSVDPLASGFPGISPYAYCYNNPMNYVDEWGLWGDPDDQKAQKNRQKAVEKYGEENVGNDKERYEFRISEKGFEQNQGDEIVDGADASAYGGEVISNRFSYFKHNVKNVGDDIAFAWDHRLIGKDIPDVITLSLDLNSTFIRGAQMSYTINFMLRGDKGAYLTRTEMETVGFGPDWGLNLGGLWYENPSNLNKERLKGPVRSASGGYLSGGNYMWNGGNNPGKIYQGASLGVGLTIGGSYGNGKTYLGWK